MLWNHGRYIDRAGIVGNPEEFFFPSSPYDPFTGLVLVSFPSLASDMDVRSTFDSSRFSLGVVAPLPHEWRATVDLTLGQSVYEQDISEQDFVGFPYPVVLNPFGSWTQLQQGLAALQASGASRLRAVNHFSDESLRLAGPVFEAPGGPATLTLLVEHRTEDVPSSIAELSEAVLGANQPIGPETTSTTSAYAELRSRIFNERAPTPLLRNLEFQLAVRDDTETSNFVTNPGEPGPVRTHVAFTGAAFTAGVKVSPLPWLMLRASYATGNTPPNLGQMFSTTNSNYLAVFEDPKRGDQLEVAPILYKFGGSPDLKMVRANTVAAGMVLTPFGLRGPRLSLDYSRITRIHDVEEPALQVVLDNEDSWPGRVRRGPLTPADQALGYTAGPIIGVDATAFNGASDIVQTLDMRLDWTFSLPVGSLHLYGAATYHFDDRLSRVFIPTLEIAGYQNAPLIWRGNAGADWSVGSLSVGANVQYFGRYHPLSNIEDVGSLSTFIYDIQGSDYIPAQAYLDLHVSKRFRVRAAGLGSDARIDVGVENVLDTAPPRQAALVQGGLSYSQFGDPRQRRFELTLSSLF
jgi:outer membrane receptor protein involved in Fe transport